MILKPLEIITSNHPPALMPPLILVPKCHIRSAFKSLPSFEILVTPAPPWAAWPVPDHPFRAEIFPNIQSECAQEGNSGAEIGQ